MEKTVYDFSTSTNVDVSREGPERAAQPVPAERVRSPQREAPEARGDSTRLGGRPLGRARPEGARPDDTADVGPWPPEVCVTEARRQGVRGWLGARGPLVVAVVTVVGMVAYFVVDHRLPRDPGLYWAELPRGWRALGGQKWGMVGQILQRPGGWLVMLMAAIGRLGRGVWLMEALSVVSVGTVVWSAGRLGAHVRGAAGGWLGALLAAGMPLVVVQGRLPWIHLPEAALLGVLMVVLVDDPALERKRSWLVAALAGAALASVRHSGLVWLVTVLPLLRGRAWLLLVPWGLGALPSLSALVPYISAKAAVRDSYAARLPGLGGQAARLVGMWTALALGVGMGLRAKDGRWDRLAWVAVLQVGTAMLMWAVFRAGLDNFTPMALGLVVLAAAGAGRVSIGLAAAGMAWVWVFTFIPTGEADFRTLHRVWRAPEVRAVDQLVAASCVDGPCRIGVDSGLYMPHGEEPGRLELWLRGQDRVQLVDLRAGARALTELPVEAVAEWDCGPDGQEWLDRFPQSRAWQEVGRRRLGLQRAWVFRPDGQCALVWWTPGGVLRGTRPGLGRVPKRRGG